MAALSSEEMAAKRAERLAVWQRRQAEPPPAASEPAQLDVAGFVSELSETLQTSLNELRPEITEIIAAIQEHRENESEDTMSADESKPVTLTEDERAALEQYRAGRDAELLRIQAQADAEKSDDALAAKALTKRADQLTKEELGALQRRTQSVLRDLGWV